MESPDRTMHLFRGAPNVRSWSKYQKTVPKWTLCGIDRDKNPKNPALATEDPNQVTCPYCRDLMRTTSRTLQTTAGE